MRQRRNSSKAKQQANSTNVNKVLHSTKAHQTTGERYEIQSWQLLDWLCYSRARNSEQLRFFQKSSAGTESSPIAFVKKGLFHRRTPGSEIAWAQARSSISESHWLVLASGDVITQRILTVTKQTRLIYRMLKGRKAYVPGKRTIVVCKSARWRQKTLTKASGENSNLKHLANWKYTDR